MKVVGAQKTQIVGARHAVPSEITFEPFVAPSKIGSSPCRYSILLQCHSEERSDEEAACSRFGGVKNIKQILHFV